MNTRHPISLRLFLTCSFVFFRFLSLPVSGQTADADSEKMDTSPAEPADSGEVYELSAFEVVTSGDRGYLSTNSTSGTSLNMAIRDLPMPLEVVNSEFMEDLQATDMDEALDYSAGVFTQTFQNSSGAVTSDTGSGNQATPNDRSPSTAANVNDPFTNTISIRGYAVPNQQRAGFRVGAGAVGDGWSIVTGGLTDTSNAERMEVVRGPASLLYGINVLSGIVNIIPKRPLPEFRTKVNFSLGSYDYKRASIDTTGPLIKDRLNYRVLGAYQDEGHYTDFRTDNRELYVGQLEWFMHEKTNTKLFLEAQYGKSRRTGIGGRFFTDVPSSGDTGGLLFRNEYNEPFRYGLDYTEASAQSVNTAYSAYYTDDILSTYSGVLELPDSVDANGDGTPDGPFSRPEGSRYWDNYINNLADEYTFRISGPDTYFEREEVNYLALLQSEPIKNLSIEAGAYYTKTEQEEFNNRLAVHSSAEGAVIPAAADQVLTFPVYRFLRQNTFWRNPEMTVEADPVGLGVIERFALINEDNLDSRSYLEVPKWASYNWYRDPATVETLQLRARVAYQKETSWFDGRVDGIHTFSAGIQTITDDINLVVSPNPSGTGTNINRIYTPGKLDQDPVIFRQSIFDLTPIRFNPATDVVAFTGRTQNISASDVKDAAASKLDHLKRSGHREIEVSNRGIYGVYQGQFFNDRLTIIGGLRQDSYQVKESEGLRIVDEVLNPSWATQSADAVPVTYTGEHFGIGTSDRPAVLPYLLPNPTQPLSYEDLPASIQNVPEFADRILLEHKLLRGEITSDELALFTGPTKSDSFSPGEIEEFKYWNSEITEGEYKEFLSDEYLSNNPGASPEEVAAAVDGQFSDILNDERMKDLGYGPNGNTRYAFQERQSFTTATAGVSFRIIDPLSVYIVHSEGVFPNQGVRDGLDRAIPAETTESNEIGFKFDLFDGKVSGTLSFFQIKRENAIFTFANAPSPSRWIGEINGDPLDTPNPPRGFDPDWAQGVSPSVWERFHGTYNPPAPQADSAPRYGYGIVGDIWQQAWAQFHPEDVQLVNAGTANERVVVAAPNKPFDQAAYQKMLDLYNAGFLDASEGPTLNPFNPSERKDYYYFDLEDFTDADSVGNITPADLPKEGTLPYQNVAVEDVVTRSAEENQAMAEELRTIYGNPILYAMELAVRAAGEYPGRVFRYSAPEGPVAHSMSSSTGANVTYEEEGRGVDGQIIFTPVSNYQIVFGFSHQKREVTGGGFNMVPLIQSRTGDDMNDVLPYADWIRYEAWVAQLGIENFEDPSDPTTFTGGSVNGIDLSLVPQWNLNLWNKYRFEEGPLEGLEIGGGVRYTSGAPTAVAVGGNDFSENAFLPPDTKERYEFDLSLVYSFDFLGSRWRLGLKVRNLLDDRVDETVTTYEYEDPFGVTDTRTLRTRTLYAPRTWRISLSTLF
jgi:outer membrane receptor for ferric coprogen and ferric-rhodotorulic acid